MPYKNKEDANRRRNERYAALSPEEKAAKNKAHYEQTKNWYKERRQQRTDRERERYNTDPEFRAKRCADKAANRDRSKEYAREVRRQYGITIEDVQKMTEAQENKCAICQETMTKPHVDHCHKSGRVRAILCAACNKGLGCFKDNALLLESAMHYIYEHALDDPKEPGFLIYQRAMARTRTVKALYCEHCGTHLEDKISSARFCSRNCKMAAGYKRRKAAKGQ